LSSTLEDADWKQPTVLKGDVAEEVAKLKEQPGDEILVAGSAQLVQTLMDHDLVDEYRLMVFPVVRRNGKRLFADGSDLRTLRVAEAKPPRTCSSPRTRRRASGVPDRSSGDHPTKVG